MLRETHKHELTSFIFPYSATSSRGVASFLLFWRNNAHSQGKWIHFCSQVSIFIYIYTGILGTSDLALSFFSRPKWRACPYSLYFTFFFVSFLNNFPLQKWPFYRDCAATGLPCSPTHTRVKVAAKYEKYEMMRRLDSDGSGNEHVWQSKRDNGGVSFVAFVTLNMSAC